MTRSNWRVALLVAFVAIGVLAVGASGSVTAQEACEDQTEYPLTVTDATGTTVTVDAKPTSVVPLQASDARTLYDIGAWELVDGYPMDPATEDLPAGNRTDITDNYQIDTEQVVNLSPDIVLAANVTFQEDIDQLRTAGLDVYQFDTATSIADVKANTHTTGELIGECGAATDTVTWMDESIQNITADIPDSTPLTYYELGGGNTPAQETFQNELMTAAGLENLATRTGETGWIQINEEEVLVEDPEWIMYSEQESEPPISTNLEATTAAQEGNYITVNPNNVSQPAPNVVHGIETMAQTIFPEAGAVVPRTDDSDTTDPPAACPYPIEMTDATGATISMQEGPKTVVALQPSDARTAYEIGAWDKVVGYPMAPATEGLPAGNRTDISSGYTTDIEEVVALDPDIVLAANISLQEDIDQLRAAGLEVYQFETATSLADIKSNTAETGSLMGACDGANETVQWMTERIENVTAAVDDNTRPLGYYEMGEGHTPGPATFQHDVLETAGLENLAERTGDSGWLQLSDEFILEHDPAWIVHAGGEAGPPISENVEFTTAGQQENFVNVNANDMSQPAPTIIQPLEQIAETIDSEVSIDDGVSIPAPRDRSSANEPSDEEETDTVEPTGQTAIGTACQPPAYPLSVTDASGATITLEEPPTSVVALQASDARTIAEIGAWDRVTGYPVESGTENLTQGDRVDIATDYEIDHEEVIDLDPDLVLAGNVTFTEDLEQLREADIPVYHFPAASTLEDIRWNTNATGTLIDECEGASETVQWMDERIETISNDTDSETRPLGYLELGAGNTAGPGTFQHDLVETAGLENVAGRADETGWFEISSEFVLEQDPDYILYTTDYETAPIPESLEATTAVETDNLVRVDANDMSQPAPTVIYAIEDIAASVEPIEEPEASTATDSDTVPGFTSIAAIVAGLACVALLRRRVP